MNTKISLKSFRKVFKTENDCLQVLLNIRIPDKKCLTKDCPGRTDRDFRRCKEKRAYFCRICFKRFHPCVDSCFEKIKFEIPDAFEILFRMLFCRDGITPGEISREFGYAPTSCYYLTHKLMQGVIPSLGFKLRGSLEGDETFGNTSTKGLGPHEINPRGKGSFIKTPILGLIERNGRCKLFTLIATDRNTIIPLIREHVEEGSTIYTDENSVYSILPKLNYKHEYVKHKARPREWTKGSASTNSAENLFSNLKRMIEGTHRYVTEPELQNYCNLIAFKHSFREDIDYGFSRILNSLPPLSSRYQSFLIAA